MSTLEIQMIHSRQLRFVPVVVLGGIFVILTAFFKPMALACLPAFLLSAGYLYVWHRTEYARSVDRWWYLLWATISIPFAPMAWLIMIREVLAYASGGRVRYLTACAVLLCFLFAHFFTASSSLLVVSPLVQGYTTPYLDRLPLVNWFLPGFILLLSALAPRNATAPVDS